MRRAYRITKRKYLQSAFDGQGARLAGGRWNLPGVPAVYCSESRALAALEAFVHLGEDARAIDFVLIEVHIPDSVSVAGLDRLPRRWRSEPPGEETMRAGSEWLRRTESPILQVPSALIPQENDFVLNPLHPDFRKLKLLGPQSFSFDVRLWK